VRVLVTGGAGFIGTNLVRRLLSEGQEPVIFDDFSSGLGSNVNDLDVRVIRGSLVDLEAVVGAAQGVVMRSCTSGHGDLSRVLSPTPLLHMKSTQLGR